MLRLELQEEEIQSIQNLLEDLTTRFQCSEEPEFLTRSILYAHRLPRRIRQELIRFRLNEPRAALMVISNCPINEERIGSTPEHWNLTEHRHRTLSEEILLVLFGSLIGECIGWRTQQESRIVHDILPIQADRKEQLGSGSETLLTWHTEDAFHPYRGDYLGMLCLRNPDSVPTTFASLDGIEFEPEQLRYLFEPHFTIKPDNSHKKEHGDQSGSDDNLDHSYGEIEKMDSEPDKIAVLFGDPESPYMRLDPYFMDPSENPASQKALDVLIAKIDEKIEDVVLKPGDICLIDNFQAVHGRRPFKARYDGTDRWMKRVNITRDLRKSRSQRESAADRVIG